MSSAKPPAVPVLLLALLPLPLLVPLPAARADDPVEEAAAGLDRALDALEEAPSERLWGEALGHAEALLRDPEGVAALYARVGRLRAAGVFADGPWADPARLRPRFVRGTLAGDGPNATREALSCLRVAAIAAGDLDHEGFGPERAAAFLSRAFALNLDLLFPTATEETRRDRDRLQGARALFDFLGRKVGLDGLGDVLGPEIAAACAQRPIVTTRTRRILARVASASLDDHEVLAPYLAALRGPTPLSRARRDAEAYRRALAEAAPEALREEARRLGAAMEATGLVGVHHVVFVRRAAAEPALLSPALAVDPRGAAELERHRELVADLIERAVRPARPQAVAGLAGVLERGLLSRPAVRAGLLRLGELEVGEAVRDQLAAWWEAQGVEAPGLDARALLVSGALSVLGQPLGVSQGQNETCQSARGISLWSQREPGYLLERLATVARADALVLRFEGAELRSDASDDHRVGVIGGLDPVSAVLTPHLDRLYAQIMRRASGRDADAHRWANPGLYGRWIPVGFTSCFTGEGRTVRDHEAFVRAFYATFHPDFDGGRRPVLPNPVGVVVTDARGRYLGLHAVSIQRVARDPQGDVRVYFFNPNGEDRQDWGQGIRTRVDGAGERPGESSLPFADFAARIYAFHHDHPAADRAAIPKDRVQAVTRRARESWGEAYRWR